MCDEPGDGQLAAVLHDRVAHVAELAFLALRLAVQAAIRVGRALMRVVLALLVVEVPALAVLIVLRLEAFMAGPRLDQRAVHRKMLVGQERLHALVVQQPVHEAVENIAFLQSLAVLRKRRRVRGQATNRRNRRL